MWGEPTLYTLLCLFYACPKVSNCLSQHHSHSCFLSLALSQQHTLLFSHVPCFVLISITLLLLSHVPCFVLISITLLLLSHVLCFVSVSRRSCALPCLSMPSRLSSVFCLVQATRSCRSLHCTAIEIKVVH